MTNVLMKECMCPPGLPSLLLSMAGSGSSSVSLMTSSELVGRACMGPGE